MNIYKYIYVYTHIYIHTVYPAIVHLMLVDVCVISSLGPPEMMIL